MCAHGECAEVWRGLPDVFNSKCQRVGMSRWFAVYKGLRALLPQWHSRALVVAYQVLQQGMTAGKAPADLLKIVPNVLPHGGADMPGESTKQPGAELSKLRAVTKNTLSLVATMLNDNQVHALAHIVVFCLRPIKEAHSSQRHRCRFPCVRPPSRAVMSPKFTSRPRARGPPHLHTTLDGYGECILGTDCWPKY